MPTNPLGEFLRARRELLNPSDVGVRVTGVRRTPGLRREEVATLAGISADYYLRLEQGRDRNPSRQVLEAVARVLRLDAAGTDHLLSLVAADHRAPRRRPRDVVPLGTRQLLDALGLPAFVEDRAFEVLAANSLATALWPSLHVGQNRLRAVFLDERESALVLDPEQARAGMVAAFRASVGAGTDDPRVARLVGQLSLASAEFARLWARHDVRDLAGGTARLQHPEVGLLELRREKLAVGGTDGQLLVVYHAERGSASEQALALLGSLALSRTPGVSAPGT
ncbi:helix-turn-helix transcriptional regulator [Kineococcus sp. NPDC059986]|uniref:helix-turn-helix domain-containing protein n=1 Tax=Kineococcus sp. NPDC059986 TaxID=3155538 RepID=UPI00344BDE4D